MTLRLAELAADLWLFGLPLIAAAAALLRLLPFAPARARYLLALAGFAAAVIVPLLVFSAGQNPLAPAWPAAADRGPALGAGAPMSALAPPSPIITALEGLLPMLLPAFLSAWALGAAVLLARELSGHILLHRRCTWRPAPPGLRARLGWPAGRALYVHEHRQTLTIGIIRPRVGLPQALLAHHSLAVARQIARHELAHMLWRDPLVHAALRMVAAVLWIAPLWLLLPVIGREREAAADAAALRAGGDREAYLRSLLGLAGRRRGRSLALAAAGGDLEYRARRMLGVAPSPASLAAAGIILVAAAALAARLPAAQFAPADPVAAILDAGADRRPVLPPGNAPLSRAAHSGKAEAHRTMRPPARSADEPASPAVPAPDPPIAEAARDIAPVAQPSFVAAVWGSEADYRAARARYGWDPAQGWSHYRDRRDVIVDRDVRVLRTVERASDPPP